MKNFRFLALYFFLNLLISGCCTKKLCTGDWDNAEFQWQDPDGTHFRYVYIYYSDYSKLYRLIDTEKIYPKNKLKVAAYFPELAEERFSIVFHGYRVSDTIKSIEFGVSTETVECNKCYPYGKNKQTIKQLKHFDYWYNGRKYGIKDKVKLVKK